jgi:predicted MarR family transcription regulator
MKKQKIELSEPTELDHWHLAHTESERFLAEFEHTLICLAQAFDRHNLMGLVTTIGDSSFNGQDNIILHIIGTLDRPKSLSDISRFMNRDDLANIQYSVRKLLKTGLIEKANDKSARGTNYRVSAEGRVVVDAFVKLRQELIVEPMKEMEQFKESVKVATKVMGLFVGMYDQSARVMTTRG